MVDEVLILSNLKEFLNKFGTKAITSQNYQISPVKLLKAQ